MDAFTRRARPLRAIAVALALLGAACGGSSGTSSGDGLTAGGLDPITADAPAESIAGITFDRFDGRPGSFGDYAGSPLVVNFFASWCVPCITEMPDFEAVHQRFGDRVRFLGLNVQDQLADGKEIAIRTGVTYDLGRDPRGEILRAFGGKVMPTTAFVAADGTVVEVSSKKLTEATLTERIKANFP